MSLELVPSVDRNGRNIRRWKKPQVAADPARFVVPEIRLASNVSADLPELEPHIQYDGQEGSLIVFRLGSIKVHLEPGNTEDCWIDEEQRSIDDLDALFGPGTTEDLLDYHEAASRQPALPFMSEVGLCIKGSDFDKPLRTELYRSSVQLDKVQRATASMGSDYNKPGGGLWASIAQTYSDDDGREFLVSDWEWKMGRRTPREDANIVYHSVSVHPQANVLVIDSWDDYVAACDAHPYRHWDGSPVVRPDYAHMAERGVDALYFTDRGLRECDGWGMEGAGSSYSSANCRSRDGYEGVRHWDVPTVVFFNPAAAVVEASGTRQDVEAHETKRFSL